MCVFRDVRSSIATDRLFLFAFFLAVDVHAVGWQVDNDVQPSAPSAPLPPYVRPLAIGFGNGSGQTLAVDMDVRTLESAVALRFMFAHFFSVPDYIRSSRSVDFVKYAMAKLGNSSVSVVNTFEVIAEDIRRLSPCEKLKAGDRELHRHLSNSPNLFSLI